MVKHVFIITGGSFDSEWFKTVWPGYRDEKEEQILITADKGLQYAEEAGILPDRIIGDFDSLPGGVPEKYKELGIPVRTFPPEKDYTDTNLALMWAVKEGADKVTLFGAMGTRFDHGFANIGLLSYLLDHKVTGEIVDPYNRITMMNGTFRNCMKISKIPGKKEYISLIPYTEKVTGVNLEGFKYPLQDAVLKIGESLGISNELTDTEGRIQIREGILMVIRASDC